MVARLACLAVILTVAHPASTTDTPWLRQSWNSSVITLKIPRDFPPDASLLSLALVHPRASQDPTLGELRRRPQDEAHPEAGLPTLPPGAQMVLLTNPNQLFHPRLRDSTDTINLRLQRQLNLSDYSTHSDYSCIEAVIGVEGTKPPAPRLWNGCGRRKNGRGRARERDGFDGSYLVVRLIITEPIDCQDPPAHACLLPEEDVWLHQWENRRRWPLLALARPTLFCPNLTPVYSVTMADSELVTKTDQLVITPAAILDREASGTLVSFTVGCELLNGAGVKVGRQMRDGRLFILDEDDSGPVISRSPHVNWHMGNNDTDDLDDQLMILDHDLESTNNYVVQLLGTTHGLVILESVNKFGVRRSACAVEAGRNSNNPHTNADCTVLTPVLKFNDTKKRWDDIPSQIRFQVAFIDKTYTHPRSGSGLPSGKQASVNVTLTVDYSASKGHRQALQTAPSLLDPYPTLEEDPPEDLNVTVTLPVTKYQRLGQLISPFLAPADLTKAPPAPAAFKISSSSEGMGISVTVIMGILYVDDPKAVVAGDLVVMVQRGEKGDMMTTVRITVEEDTEGVSPCSKTAPEEITMCSEHAFNKTCKTSCGLASAGGACAWREYEAGYGFYSANYATCSPDLTTCPDTTCDELENQHQEICPQDCVDGSMVNANNVRMGSDGRGIAAGLGVCTCDHVKCSCFPNFPTAPPATPDSDTEPIKIPTDMWACGDWCKVGVVGAAVFFIGLILVCALICKRRAGDSRKNKGSVITLGTFPGDERSSSVAYNTRDETHDSLVHGIGAHRNSPRQDHHSLPQALDIEIDRKWEFPRSRLVIEQTLGEGEFGKVMKAKAQGINGTIGYTTVAVKMLKPNSTPAELNDLLSEYNLLKEVSHPNVVRLMGACTKGGPVYIIIEYCQHGSLRNYLKRARHFEFEHRVGSGPSEGTAMDHTATPKDLLSFAWQICKGMAYLTDMKLVHRDLAARNVLLASGKQCKISDFGLTRDVYEGDLYFKRSKGRVPVKWMALESLVDHIYTSKSDVWGFGVLLWELVTLGTPPYPGITPERLFSLLKAGYRMERPDNCSQELYDVMLHCWAEDPGRRPTFQQLTDVFETMIQADVEYLELRSLIVTNRGYFDSLPPPLPAPRNQEHDEEEEDADGDEEEDEEDEDEDDDDDEPLPPPAAQQVLDAPPQFRDAPTQPHFPNLPPPQFREVSPSTSASSSSSVASNHRLSGHLLHNSISPPPPHMHRSASGWSPPGPDVDYLVARTDTHGLPQREESREPLLAHAHHHHHAHHRHAHNPSYSPAHDTPLVAPIPPPLHYSTLAARPDEEDTLTLECSRSEDSDSGRATGDSGYATTEERGRGGRRRTGDKLASNGPVGSRPLLAQHQGELSGLSSPQGASYSPLPHRDLQGGEDEGEEEQDTSEDLEERQELLAEDLIGGSGHLTPSPSPEPHGHPDRAHTPSTTRHPFTPSTAHHHTTPIIV